MSLASFIGLRYLRAKKANAFLSLITFLSVAGVALGVSTLIVTLSVMDGFEGALKGRLALGDFHILVNRSAEEVDPYFTFESQQVSRLYSLSSDILSVNPVLTTEAILRSDKKVAGISFRGINESHAQSLVNTLVEAREGGRALTKSGVWLGQELAINLNILPGDKVQIISPIETEGPFESVPKVRVFQVDGIFESGLPEKDLHTIYGSIEAVREFLGKPNQVNRIEISVRDYTRSENSGNLIREELGTQFLTKDWNQLNAHLFASLKLERITMFVILTMIILVASFNIVTSLRMTVIEKRKEIAILQAMGASSRQIGNIFLYQGLVIGNVGAFIGLILGLAVVGLLAFYPVVQLPDIFFDRTLPVKISPFFILGVALTAVIIVVVAAFFPARAAAKVPPLEGIRNI
ncbi:MAG: FtsX-like permease family protein [Oligoflexia bacterium]|nr:FtsX-like permease family protein [Oligoflexia bacterium]